VRTFGTGLTPTSSAEPGHFTPRAAPPPQSLRPAVSHTPLAASSDAASGDAAPFKGREGRGERGALVGDPPLALIVIL